MRCTSIGNNHGASDLARKQVWHDMKNRQRRARCAAGSPLAGQLNWLIKGLRISADVSRELLEPVEIQSCASCACREKSDSAKMGIFSSINLSPPQPDNWKGDSSSFLETNATMAR
ncbi:hypothetical protein I7I53_08695 [Histoplasma capsulatum var. duboisii H88]|uniref:Uncharacterized protein n=1 Tax=Ajellomyces capsulatus (strain H88) TaxID=544711 RepID=A0A8A1L4V3_AJEC8|nr:hypothetical protein I7I53_08695 [Histoplasma capsulatum var. duboisii H88]